ncbi:MAG: glycosyltransferase family 2 protein [Flavobacteriales bacterium]
MPERCRVTVVVPCRNEEEHIGALLDSLAASDHPLDLLEVLVCDGMSDDGTRAIVAGQARRRPFIRLVDNPQRTTPHALNIGLQTGSYDVVIILGAHAEVMPDFIRRSVEALRNDLSVGCAGGVIENVYTTSVARRIGAAMGHPFGVGGAYFRTGRKSGYVDTVAFGAYRREVVQELGGFDEELARNQDDEFNFRVIKAGYRILLDPAIRSRYFVRASYGRLYRQYDQYGFWKVYVNRKLGTITTLRQLVPALWMAFLFLGAPLACWWPWATGLYAAGVVLYSTVALICAVRAAPSWTDVPGVLYAFLILHAGYGIGYLRGLFLLMLLRQRPGERSMRLTRGTTQRVGMEEEGGLFRTHGRWGGTALLAFSVALPLAPLLVPLLAVIAAVFVTLAHRHTIGQRTFPSLRSPLSWSFLLYLLYLVGLGWSTNFDYAGLDLGIKASMALGPLMAWAVPGPARKGGRAMLAAFVVANVAAVCCCIAVAMWRLVHEAGGSPQGAYGMGNLIASRFSLFLHPSYAAMYLCFALGVMAFGGIEAWLARWSKVIVPVLLLGVVLCASKVGWVVLPFLFLGALLLPAQRQRRRLLLGLGLAAVLVFVGLMAVSPYMRDRLTQVVHTMRSDEVAPDAQSSSDVRRLVWHAGSDLVRTHWRRGTGTGDVKDALVQRYTELGYTHAAEQRLNAHSQFLQTTLTLGVLGGSVLLLLVLVPLIGAVRQRDGLLIFFLSLCAVNWAVESMLEVQAGVLFLVWGALVLFLRGGRTVKG